MTSTTLPVCTGESSLEQLYGAIYAIRLFEQSLLQLFARGVLSGTTHTCLGQEATAVGVMSAIDRERDIVFSNHRGHGHFLAYCGAIEDLYLELMGKRSGVCGGRGGSQHLYRHNFYSNGVQGGVVPVATGVALAERVRGRNAVVVVFLGDGTLGEGVVYESLNIAALWSLPLLFVIDDNQYAQSTPTRLQLAGSMRGRFEAFDIACDEQATTDVREVSRLARGAVSSIRQDGRPRGLILHTYRLGPHSKGDDTRDVAEIRAAWEREPLAVLQADLPEARRCAVEAAAAEIVNEARTRALAVVAAPEPSSVG